MKKILLTIFVLIFTFSAKSQCLSGDCKDGFGKKATIKGVIDYLGFFENGKETNIGLTISKQMVTFEKAAEKRGFAFVRVKTQNVLLFRDNKLKHGFVFNLSNYQVTKLLFDDKGEPIGKEVLKENATDKGCAMGDCQNGLGVRIISQGNLYIGTFKNGIYNGYGGRFTKKYNLYGQFKDGEVDGIGMKTFGGWDNYIIANYKKGKLNGKAATITLGEVSARIYKDDKMVKEINSFTLN